MAKVFLNKYKTFTTSETEATTDLIKEAIELHQTLVPNYQENEDLYMSDHPILHERRKEAYKPDNRLVVNYAKYIVDTFGGFHMGVPVKVDHPEDSVAQFIQEFRNLNDMEDTEYEIAKDMDIFGHAFIYLYQGEDSLTHVAYESPLNMLIIHDDSIQEKPLFAIRYERMENSRYQGEVITRSESIDFTGDEFGACRLGEVTPHIYGKLPVIEAVENEERQSIFEPVKTLINAVNKALSEKANDVDYFADAYLKIIGHELEDEATKVIRDSRIINLYGEGQMDANFMQKPNADTTQENLLASLKEAIFTISMVANISAEDFGNASGTALAFRLQPMLNLAKTKDRKMQSAFNRMYEVVFSMAGQRVRPDDWMGIEYSFLRNMPKNVAEEAEVVRLLDGQVSDETKLSVLSIIDNAKEELQKMENEDEKSSQLAQVLERNRRMTDADLFDEALEDE